MSLEPKKVFAEMGKAVDPGSIAAGARVAVRDAEWLVRKVDRTSHDSLAVSCVGLSELVKDKEATFLTDLDEVEVLPPGRHSRNEESGGREREPRMFQ